VAAGLVGCAMGLHLLLTSHRVEGRLFAAAGSSLALAVLCAAFACWRPRRRWLHAALAAVVAFGGFLALLLARTPDGRAAPDARVCHRYVGGGWHFQAHSLGNLLPELDQFRAGFPLISALDPLFTRQQARALADLTTAIYDELEADPDFHALGSAMPEAYAELLGRDFEHGHYFLYVPSGADRATPRPALVFLHGSGGNFKAYTWLLAQVADRVGCVLVAPSFGMGDWREPDTSRVVEAALDDAARDIPLDRSRLHLVGLSNGGLGVSQAGASIGSRFQSLTFLSPVIDTRAIASAEFTRNWRGRPIRILTGADDDRVPLDFVLQAADTLRSGGADLDLRTVENADHFLLFSHRTEVLRQIEDWLAPLLAPPAASGSPSANPAP
jgi:predicted esterase